MVTTSSVYHIVLSEGWGPWGENMIQIEEIAHTLVIWNDLRGLASKTIHVINAAIQPSSAVVFVQHVQREARCAQSEVSELVVKKKLQDQHVQCAQSEASELVVRKKTTTSKTSSNSMKKNLITWLNANARHGAGQTRHGKHCLPINSVFIVSVNHINGSAVIMLVLRPANVSD